MPACEPTSASCSSPAWPRTTPVSRSPTRGTGSTPIRSRPRASACACSPSSPAAGGATAPTAAARCGSRSTAGPAASAAPPSLAAHSPAARCRRGASDYPPNVRLLGRSVRKIPSAAERGIRSLRSMPRRDQRILLGLAALTALFAIVQSVTGISGDVLLAAPVLILLLPLLAGRYVGEDGIARLSATLAPPRRRPVVASMARGENHGFRSRRYWRWSGGSICV